MSIYAVETYGIADSVNGVGAPANGDTNHPGDYAQEILNLFEIVKEEHSKSQLSIYAVETYGIADSVNGVGAPANGGTNHPGDYASEIYGPCH